MHDDAFEYICLGSGTSSAVPLIACLTGGFENTHEACETCLSTLTPQGAKNNRGNTSAIIRWKGKTILIDCGKTFRSSILQWFPKYGIRRLDAVLLTHGHADAILGLDDLRGFTHKNAIQSSIDIYLTPDTYVDVSKAFGYLTDPSTATGGGDVPTLNFHVTPTGPFTAAGLPMTFLDVEHGVHFGAAAGQPYLCSAIQIGPMLYMSDVSSIPNHTMNEIQRIYPNGVPMLVIDTLRPTYFISHFGIAEAFCAAMQMQARKTYLIGFGHNNGHKEWEALCRDFKSGKADSAFSVACFDLIRTHTGGEDALNNFLHTQATIEPAYDGLQVVVSSS